MRKARIIGAVGWRRAIQDRSVAVLRRCTLLTAFRAGSFRSRWTVGQDGLCGCRWTARRAGSVGCESILVHAQGSWSRRRLRTQARGPELGCLLRRAWQPIRRREVLDER